MTEEEQTLRDVLCWAAGAAVDVSGIASLDVPRLWPWIARHKLAVRFHRRAQAERPRWYTRALSLPLWQESRQVRLTVERQIEAAREIVQAAQASGLTPPIPLKGFTTYALTGDDGVMRPSGDLDLLAGDPEALISLMTGLGYATLELSSEGHEAAKMQRGGVEVEVHRHVPVAAYPEALADQLDGADQRGGFLRTEGVSGESRALTYADFEPHLTRGAAPGTECFPLPSPSLACLVLCVHSFRDYVEREGPWLNHPIPVADLADLRDLAARPGFNAAEFCALAEQAGARHSVEAAARMLETWLGDNPLPSLAGKPSAFFQRSVFPQRMTWHTDTWAFLGPLENLPVRSLASALDALGGVTTLDAACPTQAYATPGAVGIPFVTALVREGGGERLAFRLAVSATDTRLTMQVEMPPLPLTGEDSFLFSFGGGLEFFWRYNGSERDDRPLVEVVSQPFPAEASVMPSEDGYRFCLDLPLAECVHRPATFEAYRWPGGLHVLVPIYIVCQQSL